MNTSVSFIAEDAAMTKILISQRHLFEAHRRQCIEASDMIAVSLRDFEKNCRPHPTAKISHHFVMFASIGRNFFDGSEDERPADAEMVIYFDRNDDVEARNEVVKIDRNSVRFVEAAIKFDWEHFKLLECFPPLHSLRVLCVSTGLVISVKTAVSLEQFANLPPEDIVQYTWASSLKHYEEMNRISSSGKSVHSMAEWVAMLPRMSSAKLAMYLQELPMFVKDVVLLVKLCLLNGVKITSTRLNRPKCVELAATKCALDELVRANESHDRPSYTKALLEVFKLFTTNKKKINVVFERVPFCRVLTSLQYLHRRYSPEPPAFVNPVNPYVNHYSDGDPVFIQDFELIRTKAAELLEYWEKLSVEPASDFEPLAEQVCNRIVLGNTMKYPKTQPTEVTPAKVTNSSSVDLCIATTLTAEDTELNEVLTVQRPLVESGRMQCTASCDILVRKVVDYSRQPRQRDWILSQHVILSYFYSQTKTEASVIEPSRAKLVIYFSPARSKSVELAKASEAVPQLKRFVGKALGFEYSTLSNKLEPAKFQGFLIEVDIAVSLTKPSPGQSDSFARSTWKMALEQSRSVLIPWRNVATKLEFLDQLDSTLNLMASAMSAQYQEQQVTFVKDTVLLVQMWSSANGLRRYEFLTEVLELIAIKCGQTEVQRAEKFDIEPSIAKAFLNALKVLAMGLKDVRIHFDGVQFPTMEAHVEFLLKSSEDLPFLLDPVNPFVNHLLPLMGQSCWTEVRKLATKSLEDFRSNKVTVKPVKNDLKAAQVYHHILGIRSERDVKVEHGSSNNYITITEPELSNGRRNLIQLLVFVAFVLFVLQQFRVILA